MTTLRKQIKYFIHARKRTSRAEIAKALKITPYAVAQEVSYLVLSGEVFSMPSVGYFKDASSYQRWFEDTRKERSERARNATKKEKPKPSSCSASIIADCRNSETMKRILSFYGKQI